jgi:hypothetical protein
LPILHRVREHLRGADVRVREYSRGAGQKVQKYAGEFEGAAGERLGKIGDTAKEKVRKKLEEKQAEQNIRKAVREEEQEKERERKKVLRLKRITREEEERARRGGFLKRGLSELLAAGKKEASKQLKPRRSRSKKRR